MTSNDYLLRCAEIIVNDKNISEQTIIIMFLEYKKILLNETSKKKQDGYNYKQLKQNKIKKMIAITDFSETTLKKFKKAKKSKSFFDAWDFVQYLINLDFDVKEVKKFAKKEFPKDYEFLSYKVL